MTEQHPFTWRHFQAEIILLCVPWYAARMHESYRNLEEMMLERGLHVDHTTIYRWGKSLCAGTGEALSAPPQNHQRLAGSVDDAPLSKSKKSGSLSIEPL